MSQSENYFKCPCCGKETMHIANLQVAPEPITFACETVPVYQAKHTSWKCSECGNVTEPEHEAIRARSVSE